MISDCSSTLADRIKLQWDAGQKAGAGPDTIAGDPLFVFEPFGLPLPHSLFAPVSGGTAVSPIIASERLSGFVDGVREIVPGSNQNSVPECGQVFRHVSSEYADTINAASPLPSLVDAEITAFEKAKSSALKSQKNAERSSSLFPLQTFMPAIPFPVDWYDSDVSGNWISVDIDLVAGSGAGLMSSDMRVVGSSYSAPSSQGGVVSLVDFVNVIGSNVEPHLSLAASYGAPVNAAPQLGSTSLSPQLAAAYLRTFEAPVAAHLLKSTPLTLTLYQVRLQCSACVIDISRPWLDWTFCERPGWYNTGLQAGDKAKRWPTISVGMAVIKDIGIEIRYACDLSTHKKLESAVSFGPLCLFGRKIVGFNPVNGSGEVQTDLEVSRFTVSGMQLIGWIVQPLTNLPPCDDPSFESP